MFDAYRLAWPILKRVDPERAHELVAAVLRNRLLPPSPSLALPRLSTRVLGLDFSSPIGLAAGFDKNAELVAGLFDLGFGFVEIGTVTPRPQPGNERPRLFRLVEDRALINRLGFNNLGCAAAAERLSRLREAGAAGPVGVNLGKNKTSTDAVEDYVRGVSQLGPLADYLVVNVSSPNTPGLRGLQRREPLMQLAEAVLAARELACPRTPLLLKIAPDLSSEERSDIAEVALAARVDGLVVSNTTIERPSSLASRNHAEGGGLSGAPLFTRSTELLREMRALTGGKLVLIGVGGVMSAADAYEKLRAGASLVQVYTGLVYGGPRFVRRLERGLDALLERDRLGSVAEAVGLDA